MKLREDQALHLFLLAPVVWHLPEQHDESKPDEGQVPLRTVDPFGMQQLPLLKVAVAVHWMLAVHGQLSFRLKRALQPAACAPLAVIVRTAGAVAAAITAPLRKRRRSSSRDFMSSIPTSIPFASWDT